MILLGAHAGSRGEEGKDTIGDFYLIAIWSTRNFFVYGLANPGHRHREPCMTRVRARL